MPSGEIFRRQFRRRIVVQPQKIYDVLDDLGKHEFVAAGDHRHATGTKLAQPVETVRFKYIYRVEFDPTDREVILYPETARSVRLPEDRDGFAHIPVPPGVDPIRYMRRQ